MKEIYRKYIQAFKEDDISVLDEIFAENAIYIEYMGLEYVGLKEIKSWFSDWHKVGQILGWDVKDMKIIDNLLVAEWNLKYEYEGDIDEYDAVALVEFDDAGKIVACREFGSQVKKERPYA